MCRCISKLIVNKSVISLFFRKYSTVSANQFPIVSFHYDTSVQDQHYTNVFLRDMTVIPDFITQDEENSLIEELEPSLRRMKYEHNHWDDAIIGFRELERLQWNPTNEKTVDKIRKYAFPTNSTLINPVHVIDLNESGYIKPHIDSVKFCGNIIAGVSLLSDSIMRLVLEDDKAVKFDVLLARRSLYIMRNEVRLKFTHEILKREDSVFKGTSVNRGRRISVICRNVKAQSNN